MKFFVVGLLNFFITFGAFSSEDPKAAVEPLLGARDTFYEDVILFQDGQLTKEELVQRISDQFAPIINNRKVALRVMGKYARQASSEDRARFTERLEGSLVDAYARGLAGYGGERLILPQKAVILKTGRAIVEARLESPGKEELAIQFALGFDKNKGWLVENVVIAGINIGLTLRNQFADLVKSTGGVTGAVDAWSFAVLSDQ